MTKLPSEIDVIITIAEQHVPRITEITEQLSAKGLKNIQTLSSIGAIAGKCENSMLKKLQTTLGVSAIELLPKIKPRIRGD
jgi:hypothetical protein